MPAKESCARVPDVRASRGVKRHGCGHRLEERYMPRMKMLLSTTTLALALTTMLCAQANAPAKSEKPDPAGTSSQEFVAFWKQINNRLVVMADDFPEDKY